MNITISLTKSYSRYATVMLLSLKEHHSNTDIVVYALHNDMDENDFSEMQDIIGESRISIIPIQIEDGICSEFRVNGWSEVAAYRLLVIDLFSEEMDRILHIDVDTLITGNLDEFYNSDFDNNYLAACEDFSNNEIERREKKIKRNLPEYAVYVNSGVVLFNLKKLRQDGFSFEMFRSIPTRFPNLLFEFPDQDLINYVFAGRIKIEDNMIYNYSPSFFQDDYPDKFYDTKEALLKNTCIVHMATSDKPWKGFHDNAAVRLWWEYAQKTPYYNELLNEYLISLENHFENIHMLNKEKIVSLSTQSIEAVESKRDRLLEAISQEINIYRILQ